jgi:hypothetical protein
MHACSQKEGKKKINTVVRMQFVVILSMARTIRADPCRPVVPWWWWCSLRWPENDELGTHAGFGRR